MSEIQHRDDATYRYTYFTSEGQETRAEQALLQEYIYARDDDGAEAVIPGNMSLAFLQRHREHSMKVGIPVLDPVSLSVKMAELLVALELTQSKRAYPSPRHEY
jgi:allantoin racemase